MTEIKEKYWQTPDRKVGTGVPVGAGLGWLTGWVITLNGIDVPPEGYIAFTSIWTFAVQYVIPNK